MIRSLYNPSHWKFWLGFHVLLGGLCYVTKWPLIGWLYIFIIFSVWELFKHRMVLSYVACLNLAYIMGIELLCRIASTSPYIPYEFGKYYYLLTIGITFLMVFHTRSTPGLSIVLLCLPALFFIPTDQYLVFFVNSFSGIFITGLLGHLLYKKKLYLGQIRTLLIIILYGVVAITVSVILQSPDIENVDFELAANSQTAGNFGSNQVSTIMGVGVMVMGLSLLLYVNLFTFQPQIIALFLLVIFALRGLLTFSRGGILGGVLALALTYFLPTGQDLKRRKIGLPLFLLVGIVLAGVFFYVNNLTGNALLNRFKGETEGTQLGIRKVSLETLTSRRSTLIVTEWEIFTEHPFVGVGPGGGYYAREEKLGLHIASHTEVTRLLAEQGLLGLLTAVVFLFFPLYKIFTTPNSFDRLLSAAFFTFAIFTSMHAAMRTTITPFLWGLACATFVAYDPVIKKPDTRK